MTVELHVGYVGATREGKRVEIVEQRMTGSCPWVGSNGASWSSNGLFSYSYNPHPQDIIAPWEEPGKWIGWNGGKCPVHPKTVVEVRSWAGCRRQVEAKLIRSWNDAGAQSQPIAYRVIKEHKEPREFWVYPETGIIKDSKPACPHAIHVREVAE